VRLVYATVQFEPSRLQRRSAPGYDADMRDDTERVAAPLTRTELLGIFAFWTLMAALTAANRLADQRELAFSAVPHGVPIALAFQQMYLWALLTPFIFWLAARFSVVSASTWIKVAGLVVLGIAIAYSVDFINSTLVRELNARPQPGPGNSLQAIRDGGSAGPMSRSGPFAILRGPMILNHFILFWGVLSAGFARDYFQRFRAREREAAQLEAETAQLQTQLAEARLSALNAQLNPHFLFNTLHAVSSLVERDPRGVRRMIARLSELLRYTLDGGTDQEVLLSQEVSFLERYLEIMQIRFQGQLEIEVDVAEDAREALVPSLILQPLVENAVKHGVDKISAAGKIRISGRRVLDRLVLSVSDNGPGPAKIEKLDDVGVGLANIRQRLEQLYGGGAVLSLAELESGGTVAAITMPFRSRVELRTTIVGAAARAGGR
jgi:two-component system LytT family sensor kinase